MLRNMSDILGPVDKRDVETQQAELDKIKLESLREKLRVQKLAQREYQREFLLKKARFLEHEPKYKSFVGSDITILAKSLKNKGQVSCELLNAVMNALLNSKENITAFLKVDGALQALLRLLSGQNEKFQLIAAQCICNLALGNEKQSLQVLKAVESYLMVYLSGKNHYVKEVCAVGLGNLSRQGLQNVELLMSQGFLPKIINLLSDGDPNVEAAAVYALNQLVYQGFDILKYTDLEKCLLAVFPMFYKGSLTVAFLLSLLSSCKTLHHHFISNGVHFETLKRLMICLKEGKKEAVYFLRIVCNLSSEESVAKDFIESQDYILQECISCLLQSDKEYLRRECLSWLGNFINNSVNKVKLFGEGILRENIESINVCMRSFDESSTEKMVS